LGRFLEALGVPADKIPANAAAREGMYRSVLAERRVLVVLDDARSEAQLRPLLPAASGCLAIVTSRNRLRGLRVTQQARSIVIKPFGEHDASLYLERVLGAERAFAERDNLARIAAACGGLPLALAVAAARAAETEYVPLVGLVQDLEARPSLLGALALDDDPAADIRAVFSWSYLALSSTAAALFRYLAQHPGPFITTDAAAALAGIEIPQDSGLPAGAATGLPALAALHLVNVNGPDRHTVHDLLRAYAEELHTKYDPPVQQGRVRERLLDHYVHTAFAASRLLYPTRLAPDLPSPAPGATPRPLVDAAEAYEWFESQYPILRALIEDGSVRGEHLQVWRLAWALEIYLVNRGLWSEAAFVQRGGLQAARALHDKALTSRAHRAVARAQFWLKNLDAAVRHSRVAVRLLPEDAGPVAKAESHRQLAWILSGCDRNDEGLQHALIALDIHRAGQSVDSLIMTAHNAVANAYWNVGNDEACLEHCMLAARLAHGIEDSANHADTHYLAGMAQARLGKHDKAREQYERAVEIYRAARALPGVAGVFERLASLSEAVGDLDEATSHRRAALEIYQELDDPRADALKAQLDT
jgi:tetratricopeptide (TPR) repeat protein